MSPLRLIRSSSGASNSPVPSAVSFRAYRGVIPSVPVKPGAPGSGSATKRGQSPSIIPASPDARRDRERTAYPFAIAIVILEALVAGAIALGSMLR